MAVNPQNLSILLADDDADDRFFFAEVLKKTPGVARFKAVNNGQLLMDYLNNQPLNLPDVLFLDINMPCKNGHECLAEIKQNPLFKHLPVVICSTSMHDEVADGFYKAGAHYYLQKGDMADLEMGIESVIKLLAKNAAQPARTNFMLNLQTH